MSKNKNEESIPCKVILVGNSGVGKTSIINRYLDNYNPEEKSTIGASFSSRKKVIEGYRISFDIWDTAGEERFRSVNKIFFKEAYVCLMVYDITNEESFESIKDYWYKSVKENANTDLLFGIAGNKIDLFTKEKVDQKKVKEFCEEIDALYFKTSAKENSFIDEIFISLGKKFINSNTFKSLKSKYIMNDNSSVKLKHHNHKYKKKTGKCC